MTETGFDLHPRLAADTRFVGDLPVCRVLLMNDRRFPWVVLVPRRAGLRELHDLAPAVRQSVLAEVLDLSAAMQAEFRAEKTNVAALGNQVPQLHIHLIMRYSDDAAWPGPVWGVGTAQPYGPADAEAAVRRISGLLPAG